MSKDNKKQSKPVNVLHAAIQAKRQGMNRDQVQNMMLARSDDPKRVISLNVLNAEFKQHSKLEKNKEKQEKLAKQQRKLEKQQRKLSKKIGKVAEALVKAGSHDPVLDEITELMRADADVTQAHVQAHDDAVQAHTRAHADSVQAHEMQNHLHAQAVSVAQMHHG